MNTIMDKELRIMDLEFNITLESIVSDLGISIAIMEANETHEAEMNKNTNNSSNKSGTKKSTSGILAFIGKTITAVIEYIGKAINHVVKVVADLFTDENKGKFEHQDVVNVYTNYDYQRKMTELEKYIDEGNQLLQSEKDVPESKAMEFKAFGDKLLKATPELALTVAKTAAVPVALIFTAANYKKIVDWGMNIVTKTKDKLSGTNKKIQDKVDGIENPTGKKIVSVALIHSSRLQASLFSQFATRGAAFITNNLFGKK